MRKIGVILARLQPIHNGHIALINKALQENEEVYVFVGSADKFNARNPLPINLRIQLCEETFNEVFKWDRNTQTTSELKKLVICPLNDLTDESDNSHDWGFYLYSNVVSITSSPNFTIYYSDGYEIITTWFPGFIMKNNVSLNLLARNAFESGISATQVREFILTGNEKLKEFVPQCVYEMREIIKNHIELSKLIK